MYKPRCRLNGSGVSPVRESPLYGQRDEKGVRPRGDLFTRRKETSPRFDNRAGPTGTYSRVRGVGVRHGVLNGKDG